MNREELIDLIELLKEFPVEEQEISFGTEHTFTFKDTTIVFKLENNPKRALVIKGNDVSTWIDSSEEYRIINEFIIGL